MSFSRFIVSVGAAVVLFSQSVSAAPVFSSNPADFGGATTVVDFLTPPIPVGDEYTTQVPGVTISGGLFSIEDPNDPAITFAANGIIPTSGPFNPITFTFDQEVTQFALFGVVQDDIEFVLNGETVAATLSGIGVFGGVTDTDGFTTIDVGVTGGVGLLGLASIAWTLAPTQSVSEPALGLLLGLGVAGLAVRSRRRQH